MKKLTALLILFLAFLLLSSTLYAQSVATLSWDYPVALTEVSTYTQAVTIDSTAITTPPTCVTLTSTTARCSIPVNQLATGTHIVSIAATRNGITAETRVTGVGGTGAPSNPANPKLTITVTINVGG